MFSILTLKTTIIDTPFLKKIGYLSFIYLQKLFLWLLKSLLIFIFLWKVTLQVILFLYLIYHFTWEKDPIYPINPLFHFFPLQVFHSTTFICFKVIFAHYLTKFPHYSYFHQVPLIPIKSSHSPFQNKLPFSL